jgi:hypothetical protein
VLPACRRPVAAFTPLKLAAIWSFSGVARQLSFSEFPGHDLDFEIFSKGANLLPP